MASGWLWLNLALALIPTALICLASLACERISCSPGTGNPGRCDCPGDRFVIVSKRMRARHRQLAKVGRRPDSAVSPGALLRVHFPRGVPFAREGRTHFLRVASLIAPRSILCGPRVMGMGV